MTQTGLLSESEMRKTYSFSAIELTIINTLGDVKISYSCGNSGTQSAERLLGRALWQYYFKFHICIAHPPVIYVFVSSLGQ